MKDIKNILVVTNSTEDYRKALHYGISMAGCSQARLHVLRLIHDPFGLNHWQLPLPSLKSIRNEYQDIRTRAKKELDGVIAAVQAKGLTIEVNIAEGRPDKEILRSVKDNHIDLLIMTAHEEGHLEQMLFDQLNEEIHRKLPCTIMFVKQEPSRVKQSFCLRRDRVQPCEAY